MGVYLHKLQTCGETKHDAALQTIIEVEEFWNSTDSSETTSPCR
jgi:hypothetical protein